MKSFKGILFDFNGTLFFDSEFHIEAFQKIFPRLGVPSPTREEVIERLLGRSNAMIYRENIKADASDAETVAFAHSKESIYYGLCLANKDRFKLAEGAEEFLDCLKENGVPFTIATGSDKESVDFFFEHLGLDRWFDIEKVVYTDGSFKGKPNPDCYLLAAEKIGLCAKDCLIFEDGRAGILAADAADAACVVAIYEEGLPSPLCEETKVDLVIHSFNCWKEILSHYEKVR